MTRLVFSIDKTAALEKLAAIEPKVRASLRSAVARATSALCATVQDRLSSDAAGRGTDGLRNKIRQDVIDSGDGTIGRVFSDPSIVYARLREYGGAIAISEIAPKSAKVLAFPYRGKLVFATHAKAHQAEIEAQPFMRPSLVEIAPLFQAEMRDSIAGALS